MSESEVNRYRLNIETIQAFLPHRYPFLLIDRVLEIVVPPGKLTLEDHPRVGIKVTAVKNVTINEPFFQGHFPGFSIMPGVLIVEAMAQASSMSVYPLLESDLSQVKNFQSILVGVDEARFRKPVFPGDQLIFKTVVTKAKGKLWGFDCRVECDGAVVAEAKLLANLQPAEKA